MKGYIKLKAISLTMFLVVITSCNAQIKEIENDELKQLLPDYHNVDVEIGVNQSTIVVKDSVITINSGGNDIWSKSDSFNYLYHKCSGDFDFMFKLNSFNAAAKYSKVGIMARKELNPGSENVFFLAFSDNSPRNNNNGGFEFQSRDEKNADSKAIYPDINVDQVNYLISYPNVWLRMKRKGDHFESLYCNDGKNWLVYSDFQKEMPASLFLGIAITSNDKSEISSASFSELKHNSN